MSKYILCVEEKNDGKTVANLKGKTRIF